MTPEELVQDREGALRRVLRVRANAPSRGEARERVRSIVASIRAARAAVNRQRHHRVHRPPVQLEDGSSLAIIFACARALEADGATQGELAKWWRASTLCAGRDELLMLVLERFEVELMTPVALEFA